MSYVEAETYAKLYDCVSGRLAQGGRAMPITREAFLAVADMPPGVFDVSRVAHVDDRTFMEAAYVSLLSAIPSAETMRHFEAHLDSLSSFQFRKRYLRVLLNRCSAARKGAVILNGEDYFEQ